jgi:hypothetical protein
MLSRSTEKHSGQSASVATQTASKRSAFRTADFATQERALAPGGDGGRDHTGTPATEPPFAELLEAARMDPAKGCNPAFITALTTRRDNLGAAEAKVVQEIFNGVDRPTREKLFDAIGAASIKPTVEDRKPGDYGLHVPCEWTDLTPKLKPFEVPKKDKPQVQATFQVYVNFPDDTLPSLFEELLKLPAAARSDPKCLTSLRYTTGGSMYAYDSKKVSLGGEAGYKKSAEEKWDEKRRQDTEDKFLDARFKNNAKGLAEDKKLSRNERLANLNADEKKELAKQKGLPLTDEDKQKRTEYTASETKRMKSTSVRHEVGHAFDFRDHSDEAWHAKSGWKTHRTLQALEASGVDLWAGAPKTTEPEANKAAGRKVLEKLSTQKSEPDIAGATAKVVASKKTSSLDAAKNKTNAPQPEVKEDVPADFAQWFPKTTGYRIFFAAPNPRDQWDQRHRIHGGFVNFNYKYMGFYQADATLTSQLLGWNNRSAAFSPREWAAECYAAWFDVKNIGDEPGKGENVKSLSADAKTWLGSVHAKQR